MPSLVLLAVWQGSGYGMVIFLAGLQNIPKEFYEAAQIDGATGWHRFRYVTLPLLSPTLFFVGVTNADQRLSGFRHCIRHDRRARASDTLRTVVYLIYEEGFSLLPHGSGDGDRLDFVRRHFSRHAGAAAASAALWYITSRGETCKGRFVSALKPKGTRVTCGVRLGDHARFGLLHLLLILAGDHRPRSVRLDDLDLAQRADGGPQRDPDFLARSVALAELYREVFEQVPFGRFYLNTIIVTVARAVGQVFFAALAAFAFARLKFPGRNLLFFGVLAVMMVPGQVTLVPNYVLLKYLGWLDSYQGLIVPSLFKCLRDLSVAPVLPDAAPRPYRRGGVGGLQPAASLSARGATALALHHGGVRVLVTLWSWERLFVAPYHHEQRRHADAFGWASPTFRDSSSATSR